MPPHLQPNNEEQFVDVGQFIDRHRLSQFQMRVILLCAIAGLFDGFDLQVMGYLAPAISTSLGLGVSSLGPVFAVSFIGVAAGSSFVAPLADRIGRKRVIVISILLFAAASGLTALSQSYAALMMWRGLTGIGLGAAMPNLITLTAEYAPKRLRALLVTALFSGLSAGAMSGGIVSALLLPDLGWRAVFAVGAAAPLLLLPFVLVFLPESIRFLVLSGNSNDRIRDTLCRIDAAFSATSSARFVTSETTAGKAAFAELFADGRARGTIGLWLSFFMNLFMLVFLASWLPTMLHDSAIPIEQAITAVVMMNLGGMLGSALIGYCMDRMGPRTVLALTAGTGAALMIVFALMVSHGAPIAALTICTFMIGLCVQGGQSGLNAFAAEYYPTTIRATGVGWAFGVGRTGSIVAPLAGSGMMLLEWTHTQIFMSAVIPLAIVALGLLLIRVNHSRPEKAAASALAS